MNHATLCPCGSSLSYANCCARYITGRAIALTAEGLMRSRYTAYTQANLDYILHTMKSPAADEFDLTEVMAWLKEIRWTKLEIVQSVESKDLATVEFRAYYIYKNQVMCLHEISDFIWEKNVWYYIDGKTVMPNPKPSTAIAHKIGRNDLCTCGSNKKYKKCCGNVS